MFEIGPLLNKSAAAGSHETSYNLIIFGQLHAVKISPQRFYNKTEI